MDNQFSFLLQDLPLFNSSLVRDSINFKGNFVCILKLLHLGLNSDDDARIVIRKNLFEHLMSLYVSCLSDLETKALILQVILKTESSYCLYGQDSWSLSKKWVYGLHI